METANQKTEIDRKLYERFVYLGLIDESGIRKSNVGESDYSKHIIQPWSIMLDWNLDYFDGDIIKRVLRTKTGEDRAMDYEKIIHICTEKLRQLKTIGQMSD